MIILDTNIFIYVAHDMFDATLLTREDLAYAVVTEIEAFGYRHITAAEEHYLRIIFDQSQALELSPTVVRRTIGLRQHKKMGLGDAIIAATAIEHNLTLWTANAKDFLGVEGLVMYNPLTEEYYGD